MDEHRAIIPAVILPPGTDVFLHAVQRAAITAKPLTRIEKRAAVTRLLTEHPDWSNHKIADAAGVSRPFVAGLRAGGNVAPPKRLVRRRNPARMHPCTLARTKPNERCGC